MDNKVVFVMGIAGSGKSTYIKENFKDYKIIDLYDFQKDKLMFSVDDVWKTYVEAKDAILEAIKNNEDVVLEHTLLRAERRKFYIDAIREISNIPIEIILINPSIENLERNYSIRYPEKKKKYLKEHILQNLEVLEIPSIEEGFDRVTIIS